MNFTYNATLQTYAYDKQGKLSLRFITYSFEYRANPEQKKYLFSKQKVI